VKRRGRANPSLPELRALSFVGSSLNDLREMPGDVRITMGAALFWAQAAGVGPDGRQHTGLHPSASKMKGALGKAGVIEIRDDFDGETYRAMYTARIGNTIYVLHAFQKKSKHGIATPMADLNLIRMRLQLARQREGRAAKGESP
jgi:phage-related protein